MAANETQVGGTHYNKFGDYQHWDMVYYFNLDYYQGQITRYVMRHKDKNGIVDLKKAVYTLQKYIELLESEDRRPPPETLGRWEKREEPLEVLTRPRAVPAPLPVDVQVPQAYGWTTEGYFGDMTQHYKCKGCGTIYKTKTLEEAQIQHGTCPGRGYVAQAA